MILCIINRLGTVHADRDGHTCPAAATAPRRKGVTPLQILVYKLGPCSSCFPMRVTFDRAIGDAP